MQKIEEKYIERTSDGFAWTLRRAYRAAYGFGEKFDSVDQKGKLVRALVREKCFYQGEYTYLSMPYECSKAAVHQFTRSLAVTWAKYNINVNCIAPTWVYTPMLEGFQNNTYARLIEQHPAGRIAEVNDFLGLAIYLSTPASNYVTGQVIYVDGGWSSGKPIDIPMEQRCVRE